MTRKLLPPEGGQVYDDLFVRRRGADPRMRIERPASSLAVAELIQL
jgi:hypothetical protein